MADLLIPVSDGSASLSVLRQILLLPDSLQRVCRAWRNKQETCSGNITESLLHTGSTLNW